VDTGRWQGISTAGKPDLKTKEILDLRFAVDLKRGSWFSDNEESVYAAEIATEIQPSLPWADEHFEERVGGVPRNPDPSHTHWPWWHGQDAETKADEKFTHTYSERFWPPETMGIRYPFGDYEDVIELLASEPYTRQAYLPIFFPEDTGAVHRGRIPCSLGYHFLLRGHELHCWYSIRSCDALRHFRDDLYLAVRLVAHTLSVLFERELGSMNDQVWVDVNPGKLYFTAHSFHVHMGDYYNL